MKRRSATSSPIRWWFRSRDSDDASALSYWLLSVLGGLLCFVVLSLVWPRTVAYYTDAEYKDWIAAARPRALLSAAQDDSPFKKKLDDLIAAIEHDNPGQDPNNAPLQPAAPGNPCGGTGSPTAGTASGRATSFGEVIVYPSCVTFARDKNKKLSPDEEKKEDTVFRNFAAYIVREFDKQHQGESDSNHTERTMAKTMGLSGGTTNSSFDVPWIYVANRNGSIAVYPGTTVISDPSWKASSRPWWQETFGGQLHLGSDGPGQIGDRLTVTYLDVLTNTPILVRTYLRKFDAGEYVAAIDLYHREDQPLSALTILGVDLTKPPWELRFGIALGISLLVFGLVRWSAPAAHQKFVFELARSLYGNVTAENIIDTLKEDSAKASTKRTWKVVFGKHGDMSKESERLQQRADSMKTRFLTSDSVRGFERWVVSHQIYRSWRFLWRFGSVAERHVGEIELTYGSEILPETRWSLFDKNVFLKRDESYYESRLLEVLRQNGDAGNGRLEAPATKDELETFATVSRIPDWVQAAIAEPQQLSAIRQRRAYVNLDDGRLSEIYERADSIKAVILVSYFERLFHRHQTKFLSKGKTVSRLVCFQDENAELDISEDSRADYDELRTASRTLKRVNAAMDKDDSPQPPYDFAIIESGPAPEDIWLIVTRFVWEAKLIDRESSREGPVGYRTDCYISWRPSDVKFYEAKFSELNSKSIPMPPITNQGHRHKVVS